MVLVREAVRSLELTFAIDTRRLGKGQPLLAWSPCGSVLAAVGSSRVVHLVDGSTGEEIGQVVPPSPSRCAALEWSASGAVLAIAQEGSKTVVFWHREDQSIELVDLGTKGILCAAWCPLLEPNSPSAGDSGVPACVDPRLEALLVAFGTVRGQVLVYDARQRTCVSWDASGRATGARKRLEQICWLAPRLEDRDADAHQAASARAIVAYACEGAVLTMSRLDGQALDKVNLKARIVDIKVSAARVDGGTLSRSLSVLLDDETVALVELNGADAGQLASSLAGRKRRSDSTSSATSSTAGGGGGGGGESEGKAGAAATWRPSRTTSACNASALVGSDARDIAVLDFEGTYGKPVAHAWRDGMHLVVAFASGNIVSVRALMSGTTTEEGRVRFLRRAPRSMACGGSLLFACGEEGLQLFDLDRWVLISCQRLAEQNGPAELAVVSPRDGLVTVATSTGNVLCFTLPPEDPPEPPPRREIDFLGPLLAPVRLPLCGAAWISLAATVLGLACATLETDARTLARAALSL